MSNVAIYRAMLESPTDPQLHRPEGPALVVKLADYDALRAEVERLEAKVAEAEKIAHHVWLGQMVPLDSGCAWIYDEIERIFPGVRTGPAKLFPPFGDADPTTAQQDGER